MAGMSGEEIVVAKHQPVAEEWKVGRSQGVKLLAGMIYFVLYKQVTGSTPGQDKCAAKFRCGATLFKRINTGKWQEGGKGKSEAKSTKSSRRLAEIAKQEQSGEKDTPTMGKMVSDKQSKGPAHKRKSSKTGEKSAKKTKRDDDYDDE